MHWTFCFFYFLFSSRFYGGSNNDARAAHNEQKMILWEKFLIDGNKIQSGKCLEERGN